MFVGYVDDGPSYWIQNMVTDRLIPTTHVAFIESEPTHIAASLRAHLAAHRRFWRFESFSTIRS
jgi:hypothetical protein